LLSLGKGIVERGGKFFVNRAKSVGKAAKTNPLSTAGKGLTGYFAFSEGANALSKAQQSANRVRGANMTSPSFHSYMR
jgi:hypothetical protein